ncbi:MAG TPA: DinB family protein [Nocardioidaceae bacterium]|nr:DinB family protein [Nocardioidaceae bacterium]
MRLGKESRRSGKLPPLPAEGHVCHTCNVSYSEVDVPHAMDVIRSVPRDVRDAVAAVPAHLRQARPSDEGWSVAEYACHVRDVYVAYTIRLYRARTEDAPILEPMLNDLRARRFRYNESDLGAVLDELEAAICGFCDEVARTDRREWSRTVTRLPGEERTALWLVRQAMHEGTHHLHDIRITGKTVMRALDESDGDRSP